MDSNDFYKVYLTESPSDTPSKLTTDRIDFYDSGIWIDVEGGRDFYPYERIGVIRERDPDEIDLDEWEEDGSPTA